MHWVKSVRHVKDYVLEITFENDAVKKVDLAEHLKGKVFEPLKKIEYFKSVSVNHDIDTIAWPNGADLCPDFLYEIGESITNHISFKKN